MTLRQLVSARHLAGKACMLFLLAALLAVLDGLVARLREPVNVFQVLPGETVEVNGPLPEQIRRPEELTWVSDTPGLAVDLEEVHAGYFWGGNLWRGRLQVSPGLAPGRYSLFIRPKDYPPEKKGYELRVVVHPDPASRQRASFSLLRRLTGLPPFMAAAAALPFIALWAVAVWLLSRRIAELQALAGVAEIYHVAQEQDGFLVTFGLGARHGLREGDEVRILNPAGQPVGTATVTRVSDQDAVGRGTLPGEIRPGYLISWKK